METYRCGTMLMMNRLSDRIVGHYERHATAWDADRAGSAWNDKPWHDRFVAMLPKGASILDLGCGSGSPVARHMAAQGLKITASIHRRHSSHFVEAACPITSGSLGICAGYRWNGHSRAFWPGTAFSISITTISEVCLTSLPGTPDRPRC